MSKIDAAASALVVVSVCVSATTDSTAAVSAETVHKVTQFCVCVCVFCTLLTPVARSLTSGDKEDGALLLLERFSSNKSVCVCVVLCCPTRLTIQLA